MSYYGTPVEPFSPFHSSTPPAPPPKPSVSVGASATPSRGPPLPPPPSKANEPLELDGATVHRQQRPYYHSQGANAPQQLPPVEPGWLPDTVKDKTVTDLQKLAQDQALQSALLSNPKTTHAALVASEAALVPLIDSNLRISRAILALEEQLTTLRESTQQRLLALRALEQQHGAKLDETENALSAFSPKALYQRLNVGAQEQESLVRGLEESWLDEDGVARSTEVAEMVKRVREVRRVGFLRQERKARWDEGRVGGWR